MAKDDAEKSSDGKSVFNIPSAISINRSTWQAALVKIVFWILLFGAVICLFAYVAREMTESNPEIDDSRKEVALRGIAQMVAEIRANAKDSGPKNIQILHLANDPSDFVSENVREAVRKQGGFTVAKKPVWDRFCRMIGRVNDGVASRVQAIKETQNDGVDGVLWGRVNRLENERDGATFTGDYELYDLRNSRSVYAGRINESTVPGRFTVKQRAGTSVDEYRLRSIAMQGLGIPWHIRFLWFFVVMLLLPVVTISFIRTMVAKKSNGVNAFVLGIYTTVDLILAFFMVGGSLSSFFSVVVFLLAGIVAFLYNVKIMTFAVRLEG